ncbi:MAG: SIMPL domain-containing protein [Deltaproteobacteria bacterium HGW-Deltaproteobacteria-17]|nr:MAG: SIMPL domain-containing protein [Deltaproteobacteria bacterium HGW-Deltaproteobacteria-17]
MEKKSIIAMAILGGLLAMGMSGAAFILGTQARKAVSNKPQATQITVKGLAVKQVKADSVEWTLNISVVEPTFGAALSKLRSVRPVVDAFLTKEGIDKATWKESDETVTPHMVTVYLENGGQKQEQQGFEGSQSVTIVTKDLERIVKANKNILAVQSEGHPITAGDPLFLVGNLEEIKMSLIADATANARKRAEEFVRQDGVKVGVMRSASQGAFYILAEGASSDSDDYGGVYDKSTINKIAKVVVTIVYNIQP